MRYRIDSDDDGHWYVIEVGKEKVFDQYVSDEGANPLPDGCIPLNTHPSLVTFENWSCE